jgi:hypothetical protein
MDPGSVGLMPRHHSFTLSEQASEIIDGVPDGRTVAKWKYTMSTKHFGKKMKHPEWRYPTQSKSQFVSKAIIFYSTHEMQVKKMQILEELLQEANEKLDARKHWLERFRDRAFGRS